ncbi:MAG: dTDP-glucose 4,6-dehydratase [Acidobacteriota bacterium]
MRRILITGGAGFIGSNFARLLLQRKCEAICIVDLLTYAGHRATLADLLEDSRVRFDHGDIADRDFVRRVVTEFRPDWIVNFAAESHVDRSIDSPSDFVRTNVQGTFELLEASRSYWQNLGTEAAEQFRYLQISTDEVFGSLGPEGLFSEDTAYQPNSPYSASKAAGDHFRRAYWKTFGLPTLGTNCSNNYGPFQYPEKLIPLVLLSALAGRPIPVYGTGENVRDWIHVEDHNQAVLTVLERASPGSSYNVGGESELTNLEIIGKLCTELERRRPASANDSMRAVSKKDYVDLIEFVVDRPGHDERYAIDNRKIREDLSWQPSWTVDKGLEQTVGWVLENLDWCREVGPDLGERLGLSSLAEVAT